jgi:hypothetical protein
MLPAHAVTVVGWAVGAEGPVAAVEFEAAGEVVWRAPVNVERPDVARAFPDREVGAAGFQTTLNAQDIPAVAPVTAFAIGAEGSRTPFASLRFSQPGDDGEPVVA